MAKTLRRLLSMREDASKYYPSKVRPKDEKEAKGKNYPLKVRKEENLDEFDIGAVHDIAHHIHHHGPTIAAVAGTVLAHRGIEAVAEHGAHKAKHLARKIHRWVKTKKETHRKAHLSPRDKLHAHADKIASGSMDENETINELSKDTLRNYAEKADKRTKGIAEKDFRRRRYIRKAEGRAIGTWRPKGGEYRSYHPEEKE